MAIRSDIEDADEHSSRISGIETTIGDADARRCRALIEGANDAMLVTTAEGIVVELNRRGEELLGRSAEDVVGRGYLELFAPAYREHVAAQGRRLAAAGSARFDDVPVARPDGAQVFASFSAALVETAGERFALFIARDVTERRRAEQAALLREDERAEQLERAQAAQREAERANRAKDEFLNTLSHELRAPLTAILGWAALLHTRRDDAAWLDKAIATIERNAKMQAQIIDDLLDVTRIDTGELRLETRAMNVVPLIEAALDAVEPSAQAKGVRIESALDPEAGAMWGDPGRIQQVAMNLLGNAIKFTPRGGRVSIRLERRGPSMQLTVSDTGQGIRAEDLPHVFDRFRAAGRARAQGGLGLGLSIVRHLVELHCGLVRAESGGEGLGATFTVTLPIHASWAPPREPASAPAPKAGATPRLDGLRVLVVEDDPDTRVLLTTALHQFGARATAVSSAPEALAVLARVAPDVLVSDISMPSMDGYGLIRAVRANPDTSLGRTPAVALTACAAVEDRRAALSAGFQVHVSKPVEPDVLVAVVAQLASRKA